MPIISIVIVYYLQSFKSRIQGTKEPVRKSQKYVENENTEEKALKIISWSLVMLVRTRWVVEVNTKP